MALNFVYKKYKDVYTIFNSGILPLTYSVTRIECDSNELVKTAQIAVGETITLPLNYVDGVYSVTITDGIEEQILDDILYYNNLLLAIISNVEASLCGCKTCNECEDCNECSLYLNTLNQVLAFSIVNNPTYSPYINLINEELKCDFSQAILCMLTNSMIDGNQDTKNIYLRIIAMYYLAFYIFDLVQATDAEEANYIKCKYNSVKILKCIKKLGIDIDETSEIFLNDMTVYYWQIDDLFQDINDIIPIFGLNYLANKDSESFEVFEQGKIVPYTTIGRIAFAVRETDILNFTLLDSLGNDVTDEFDNHYFPTERTVLYVSKVPYSHSNVFFKFKKITNLP